MPKQSTNSEFAGSCRRYWCTFDTKLQTFVNCCENDSPTISGMITLFDKLLSLPPNLGTPAQRAAWLNFRTSLLPNLPMTTEGGVEVIAAAEVVSTGKHNGEGPELYAMHPHRVFTKGKAVATGLNISLGERTVANSGFAQGGDGWSYGINAQALIGFSYNAAKQVIGRALTQSAPGYRFDGFAPHFQDFDPSADHFANFARATQEMLIQSGDDGFSNTTIVLFPAWPCEWDVDFKLWGPLNTSVEGQYSGGKLVAPLTVIPPTRASAVRFANCVV